jgi:Kdo2-lipid IVA lauroyltransferase/acyltransferase
MRTSAKFKLKHLSTRKAMTWSLPPKPSWTDFRAGGERRQKWINFWLKENPPEVAQWLLFHLFSMLPITLTSNLGGRLTQFNIPKFYPFAKTFTSGNLRWLQPTWTEPEVQAAMWRNFDNNGRVNAEFAVLHRLMKAGRIQIENIELLKAALAKGPVVGMGLHLGNWEVAAPALASFGIPFFFFYEPQSRMRTHLAMKARFRTSHPESEALPPGPAAVRAALKWLKQGKLVALWCDEQVGGQVAAPFFGREPHLNSNYATAVRLARHSNAVLMPFYVVRDSPCKFTLKILPAIELAPSEDPGACLLDDVIALNAVVEPIIKDHLDQWWWLTWPINGVPYE